MIEAPKTIQIPDTDNFTVHMLFYKHCVSPSIICQVGDEAALMILSKYKDFLSRLLC